jgi:hypothetical protein
MGSNWKELHDALLAEKPDGAVHDSDSCHLCAIKDTGGAPVSDTYTPAEMQAEVDKAVKAATAALDAKVNELTEAAKTSEVEQVKAQLKAEHDTAIADLQGQLDNKVLEATAASTELTAIKAWLETEAAAIETAKVVGARKAERLDKVKAVATFPEEYLAANADRFAAMADEDFQVALDGWAAIASASTGTGSTTVPNKTALHAGRDTSTGSADSPTKAIFDLRRQGVRLDLSSL